MRSKVTLLALLPLLLSAAAFAGGDSPLKFRGEGYPISMTVLPTGKAGVTAYLGRFSEAPAEDYDTIVVQGVLSSPDMQLEAVAKSEHLLMLHTRLERTGFNRFPNGRFWARFRAPAASRRPIRFSVTDLGLAKAAAVTLYETDALLEGATEQAPAQPPSDAPYVPDPGLFVPKDAPFKLIRRAEWKANPPKEPYTPHSPYYFTLHHTQAHYPRTMEESLEEMRFIQDFHQNGRGWNDIAYHFLIDPAGNVFEGRPVNVVGAHVKNRNTGNIGISMMGSYHPPSQDVIARSALDTFVTVGRWVKNAYKVPKGEFYAHREIGQSDCPGDNLYAKKNYLRDLVFDAAPEEPGTGPAPQDPAPAPGTAEPGTAPIPGPEAPEGAQPEPRQLESLRQLMQQLN